MKWFLLLMCVSSLWAWLPSSGNGAGMDAGAWTWPAFWKQTCGVEVGGWKPWGETGWEEGWLRVQIGAYHGAWSMAYGHVQLDSLYREDDWDFAAVWRLGRIFALAEGSLAWQRVEHWTGQKEQRRFSLGYANLNAWTAAFALEGESGCLSPGLAIQWRLKEIYEMKVRIEQIRAEGCHVRIAQAVLLSPDVRLHLGWRFPERIMAAGAEISLSNFALHLFRIWHPELPSTSGASLYWKNTP
ncbi:MAG TPA: hypothetical protein VLM37_11605 [Fibrobacteraceae bacterium]|nr:hypothetical protein [Fibrobacteraceae bacterium]